MENNLKKVTSIVLNNFTNDSRVLKEAISLQKGGYDVTVVALHEEPLKEFEEVDGIRVHRIKLKSRNWGKVRAIQVLKYFELIYILIKLYRRSDILHCNDLETLPLGVILKKINKKIKIVYDAHEYETETHYSKGLRKKIAQKLERALIGHVDALLTVSDKIAQEYVRLYKIDKPALVLNTPWLQEIEKRDHFRDHFAIEPSKTIFLYQGALNEGRGIEQILETFKSLDKGVIVFMGYGILETLIKEYAQKYKNIFFHEAVAPNVVLEYTSSADFGLSLIEDSCLSYRYCLPNKMFEYTMVGIAVIVSNLPEMRRVVEEYGVGVVVKEKSAEGLKEAITEAIEMDKEQLARGIERLKSKYNWQEQEKILLKVYNAL
jgi:glycosyltransferase involved in cell wall biosynthesis